MESVIRIVDLPLPDDSPRLRLDRLDAVLEELEGLNLRDSERLPVYLGSALADLGVESPHTKSISKLIDSVFDLQQSVLRTMRTARLRQSKH